MAATPYEAAYTVAPTPSRAKHCWETREINTGVVAFRERALRTYIQHLDTDNAQGELLLTDLVQIFNQHQLVVRAATADSEEELLAFNVKSVWRQMEAIARRWAYDKLKDTITIADEEDFFIARPRSSSRFSTWTRSAAPWTSSSARAPISAPRVQLNRRVTIGDRSHLSGHVVLGEGVQIGVGVELSTYPNQTLVLGEEVEVLSRNILKGNLRIGAHSRIESGVLMTGSDEHPMRVGERVTIKGTSYLYGCHIDDDLFIEHSVIKCKRVEQVRRRDGTIQPSATSCRSPEGLDSIADL